MEGKALLRPVMKIASLGARANPELKGLARQRPGNGVLWTWTRKRLQSVGGTLGGRLADELSSWRQVQARNWGPHPRPLTLEGRCLSQALDSEPFPFPQCLYLLCPSFPWVPTGTKSVGAEGIRNRGTPMRRWILFQGRDQAHRMALPEALLPGPASESLGLLQCRTGFPHKVMLCSPTWGQGD